MEKGTAMTAPVYSAKSVNGRPRCIRCGTPGATTQRRSACRATSGLDETDDGALEDPCWLDSESSHSTKQCSANVTDPLESVTESSWAALLSLETGGVGSCADRCCSGGRFVSQSSARAGL